IPAAVIGTNKIGKSGSLFPIVHIQFGKPIYSQAGTNREALQKITDEVMENIARMLQEGSNE
ncbi:MAG: 1-acyl-sn-glycerol-3-phosphate acyltransferase, partial [Pelosinus sp.]|nr:1-acyl-sn-glycerol-3-phosphate acyltransferase [Pelosinus sp.]